MANYLNRIVKIIEQKENGDYVVEQLQDDNTKKEITITTEEYNLWNFLLKFGNFTSKQFSEFESLLADYRFSE
jgi:hypothetical protein